MDILVPQNFKRALAKARSEPVFAIRTALKRFRNYLYYRFDQTGRSGPPETVSLFLTYRCNLRCPMCGQWGEAGVFKELDKLTLKQELPIEKVREVLDELSPFRPTITLFGGEPTLHSRFLEIVAEVKSRGMRCNMVTNATQLSKLAPELVKLQMDEIIISLDGTEEIHDSIRGRGCFRKMTEGLDTLAEEKIRQNRRFPVVNFNTTITPENQDILPEMVQLADKLHVNSITFHHLLFLYEKTVRGFEDWFKTNLGHIPHEWNGFIWNERPKIVPESLIETLGKALNSTSGTRAHVYPNFTNEEIISWYNDEEFRPKTYKPRCVSVWMVAYIFPDGSVRPYHTMDYPMGNVMESSFMEIWNSSKYCAYRRALRGVGCFSVCSRGCTELYRY